MVTRRKDRPNEGFAIRITLPKPWGRVGPWQTGMFTKAKAMQVQAWLYDQAIARPLLVDGIVAHRFSLRDAWVAKQRGTLDALIAGVNDPLLVDAVAEYREVCKDERTRDGLKKIAHRGDDGKLSGYAPAGARLAWLTPVTIRQMYAKEEAKGRKPNSVRRSLHRAVVELLAFKLGLEARDTLMKNVKAPGEDDTRRVELTPEQIERVLGAIAVERFRWMVLTAIHTAADRKPLLALLPVHFDDAAGTLTIPDHKTRSRWRVLRLHDDARTVLRVACAGVGEQERLFPWTEGQVRDLWEAARAEAKLPQLRFKDLRHLMPTALTAEGVPQAEVEKVLGHAPGSSSTRRYITPVGDPATLAAASKRLGLSGAHLRAG